MTTQKLTADRAGERADALLARLVPDLTRSAAQKLLERGAVTLEGRPVRKNDKPVPGQVLEVALPDPEPIDVSPQNIPLNVVYEMIKSLAERYGTYIVGSEVVGLTPAKALIDCAEHYLKLENFDCHNQVMEYHLVGME